MLNSFIGLKKEKRTKGNLQKKILTCWDLGIMLHKHETMNPLQWTS